MNNHQFGMLCALIGLVSVILVGDNLWLAKQITDLTTIAKSADDNADRARAHASWAEDSADDAKTATEQILKDIERQSGKRNTH